MLFSSTPRWPPTITSDFASRQPRGQLGRTHRTEMRVATQRRKQQNFQTKEESATGSATSAVHKILHLKESATQWLQRRYQVEVEETAAKASTLADHDFVLGIIGCQHLSGVVAELEMLGYSFVQHFDEADYVDM